MNRPFVSITREDKPRWYGLSWDGEHKGISLSVTKEVLKSLPKVKKNAPIVLSLIKVFEFKDFEGSFEKNFGFDSSLKRKERGDWVEFKATLPVIEKLSDEPCHFCKGKKRDFITGGKCLSCYGSGKNRKLEWRPAHAISASFNLLFQLLEYPEGEPVRSIRPQLMTVTLSTQSGMHGGSIWGRYSIPLVSWLSAKKGYSLEFMVEAMRTAYTHMFGPERYPQRFRAVVEYEGGRLNVDCPGNACGLHPSHSSFDHRYRRSGYEFSCHNVDTAAQQLTLLAGLAALHDEVDSIFI